MFKWWSFTSTIKNSTEIEQCLVTYNAKNIWSYCLKLTGIITRLIFWTNKNISLIDWLFKWSHSGAGPWNVRVSHSAHHLCSSRFILIRIKHISYTVGNNCKRGRHKRPSSQIWFNLVQQFQRRRFKCESLRRTTEWRMDDNKSSHGVWPVEL